MAKGQVRAWVGAADGDVFEVVDVHRGEARVRHRDGSEAWVEDTVVATRSFTAWGSTASPAKSAAEYAHLACHHANEAPRICPCKAGCYCKTRTCRASRTAGGGA